MSSTKDRPSLLHRNFHDKTVLQACGYRLLAENMVSLLSERQDDVEMHLILHSNNDSVGEAFTNGIDSLRRGGM
jgi:hypothetical protein